MTRPPKGSFAEFCDSFLVACADNQPRDNLVAIDVREFCAEHFPDIDQRWVETVIGPLVNLDVGLDWSTQSSRVFRINGRGLLMAEKIKEGRRRKNLKERLGAISRSDWIAFGAFVVSLIALLK